jgi:hypothetical protein
MGIGHSQRATYMPLDAANRRMTRITSHHIASHCPSRERSILITFRHIYNILAWLIPSQHLHLIAGPSALPLCFIIPISSTAFWTFYDILNYDIMFPLSLPSLSLHISWPSICTGIGVGLTPLGFLFWPSGVLGRAHLYTWIMCFAIWFCCIWIYEFTIVGRALTICH